MGKNPFIVGQPVPPESFVGRKSEIDAAFDQIFNRSHLAIWGGAGMGKSSFLEKLASPQVWEERGEDLSKIVIVLFSCQSINPFTPSGFWREVLSGMRDQLDIEPDLQTEIETLLAQGLTTKDCLRQILRKLGRKGKSLVLLVDDYDAALQENKQYTEADMVTFLSECRNLAYHSKERNLSMIVTSLMRLNELGPPLSPASSPWYNHYLFQSLKLLTEQEAEQLLGIAPQTPESQPLRDIIREIAGGHPALLQNAGSLLYRKLRTAQGTAMDAQAFATAFAREFKSDTRQIFQNIWDRCSEEEQSLLMLIALYGLKGRLNEESYDLSDLDIIFSQKERELTNLEEQGVITRTELVEQGKVTNIHEKRVGIRTEQGNKKILSFTSSLMEEWVIQELRNTNNESLEKRRKVFLNLMSHEQTKNVTQAIRWLWNHTQEISSALELFGKLSAAFPKGAIQGLFNWM
ncbi:ATP-binding protein [Brasilonema sp. UFV-L1]|uniref:AAA family ATPase n=1 Tax=Brasilonema sp. UFV-L1 TaxID=2234130 RepID=UPI00145E47DF|nr:ATP-binding protein [Brasilonema sp. UFV-L1]NMG08273.1 ATP-binding protein [Brasilonema sp. UFV-L1]